MADCHPNLPHWSRGMCSTCYQRTWRQAHPDRVKKRRENRPPSACHPDKPVLARGMCDRCYRRWWRAEHPGHNLDVNADQQAARYQAKTMDQRRGPMLRRYGLTVADYDRMVTDQGGLCAACHRNSGRRLHVDHDHETGRVRGLLCFNCNSALGHAQEDVERLRALIGYLESRLSLHAEHLGASR